MEEKILRQGADLEEKRGSFLLNMKELQTEISDLENEVINKRIEMANLHHKNEKIGLELKEKKALVEKLEVEAKDLKKVFDNLPIEEKEQKQVMTVIHDTKKKMKYVEDLTDKARVSETTKMPRSST